MKFVKVTFLHVSVHRGRVVSQHALQVVSQHALQVSGGCVSQHVLQVSRPTPKGEFEGSGQGGLQAHSWGGVSQHALRQTPQANGYCCGRYASYWNVFLLRLRFVWGGGGCKHQNCSECLETHCGFEHFEIQWNFGNQKTFLTVDMQASIQTP